MNNDWKTGCMLEKAAFEDIILHANSDTEAEMDIGEIWFDTANDVYKGKNSVEVIQFAVQSDVDALEGRMDTAEGEIDTLQSDMTTAQGDITALQGRMNTAEGEIDTLQSDMTTAQGDITALQGRMNTAEGEIDNLQSDMTTAQGDITALQGRMTTAEGEIDTLQSDLSTLETRVAVETDTDGHGKMSYLKEQTTEPSPGTDEGVIYTADDGGDTVLYYKANGEVVELARPGQYVAPGYIAGMQISRASDTSITIKPGVCEIGCKLYELPNAVTITVPVTAALYWRGINIATLPANGNVLTAANFSTVAGANVVKSSDGTHWVVSGAATQRIIGIYPAADNAVLSTFTIMQGKYYCFREVINDTTPPTSPTSYNIGLPALGNGYQHGEYIGIASGDANTTMTTLSVGGNTTLRASGNDVAGSFSTHASDGIKKLHVTATNGTADSMNIRLYYVDIPTGMAR